MTLHHKPKEDKLININLLIFKGKITFKQFLTILVVCVIVIAFAFSSFQISSKYFSYEKKSLEVKTNSVKVK